MPWTVTQADGAEGLSLERMQDGQRDEMAEVDIARTWGRRQVHLPLCQ